MRRYRIRFRVNVDEKHYMDCDILMPENRGIPDVKEGFWVNENFDWAMASDVRWFVMPHMILSVQAVTAAEDGV